MVERMGIFSYQIIKFSFYFCTMSIHDIKILDEKETRAGFGDGILEAGRRNPNVVALTADLAGSLKLNAFIKESGCCPNNKSNRANKTKIGKENNNKIGYL